MSDRKPTLHDNGAQDAINQLWADSTLLQEVAEGAAVTTIKDRYIRVRNPQWRDDKGNDPFLILDASQFKNRLEKIETAFTHLRKQLSDAVGALEPFAEAGRAMLLTGGNNPKLSGPRLAEHLERARSTLATLTGGKADA